MAPAYAHGGEQGTEGTALEGLDLPPEVSVHGTNGKWTYYSAPLGRVYGMPGDGYALIAGASLEDVCSGPPGQVKQQIRKAKDGTFISKIINNGLWTTVNLYKTDLGVFAFFDKWCPVFGGGGDIPQPTATGIGILRDKSWTTDPFAEFQPVGRYRNGVRATLFGSDGTYKVRTLVDYKVITPFDPHAGTPDVVEFAANAFKVKKLN
jgi:hypothetical protein